MGNPGRARMFRSKPLTEPRRPDAAILPGTARRASAFIVASGRGFSFRDPADAVIRDGIVFSRWYRNIDRTGPSIRVGFKNKGAIIIEVP